MAATTRPITIDDLMRLGSDAHVEVIDGEIVGIKLSGALHAIITHNIVRSIDRFVRAHKSGITFSFGLLYVLVEKQNHIFQARVPDVSFIRKEVISPDWNFERPFPGAPTLAVEVMSPDDQFEDVVKKVREYFSAGTSEVWVVLPRQKTLYRYVRGEAQVVIYDEDGRMDAAPLFPGLTLALVDIFALPDLGE